MTTLCTADLHFSANPRDTYRFHFLERELPRLIKEHAVTRVLVLGDLTESKDGHNAALVNRVVDGFAIIAQTADVIFLKGNHDYLRADVPFWRFFQHVPRVRWINEPTLLKLRGLGDCLFIPHASYSAEDLKRGPLVSKPHDWIFWHHTIAGAMSESGRKLEGLPPSIFPKAARVVAGDVHVPQKIGPVTYAGAPFHVDFGDTFEPRVLLLDSTRMQSVPVEGPQKRLVVADGRDPINAMRVNHKHPLLAGIDPVHPGDVVKVRVELPPGSELSRAQVRAAAREWAAEAGVTLYAVQVIAPEAARSEKAAARPARHSDDDLVRAYVKKMAKGKITLAAGLKIAGEVT